MSKCRIAFRSLPMIAGLAFMLAPPAIADSFCAFDTGLIGTTGIGYVFPYSARSSDADYDYETKTCRVPVFEAPESKVSTLVDCLQIESFPTPYHSDEAFVTGLLDNGFPLTFSDYFAFAVYDYQPTFAQIQLHSGEEVWVKTRYASNDIQYQPHRMIGFQGQTSSNLVFEGPDVSEVATPADINGPIAQTHLERLLDDLGIELQVPEKEWDWHLRHEGNDYYYGFTYTVTDLHEANDGWLWYVATEHLTIDALANRERHQQLQKLFGTTIHGSYSSPAIRTVYLPFRDRDGIVQSVFLPGPYCD